MRKHLKSGSSPDGIPSSATRSTSKNQADEMQRCKVLLSPAELSNSAENLGLTAPHVWKSHAHLSYQLGRAVFRRRCEVGFSQKALAELHGLRSVGDIERGGRNPTLHTLVRICAVLDLELSKLCETMEAGSAETEATPGKANLNEATENLRLSTSCGHHELGKVVRKRRTELGLSQRALAESVGVQRTYVTSFEAGKQNALLYSLTRICAGLDLRLSELCAAIEGSSDESKENSSKRRHEKAGENLGVPELRVYQHREMLLSQFGKSVRKRRAQLGLSQKTIEESGDLACRDMEDIEAGRRNVRFDTLARLCSGLGLRTSELCAAIEADASEMKATFSKAEPSNSAGSLGLSLARWCRNRELLLLQVGKVVRARRTELKLSQSVVAERCGLCKPYVALLEAGRWNTKFHTLARICEALDLRLSELFAAIEGDSAETKESPPRL